MRSLSFDTSGDVLSAAVLEGGRVLAMHTSPSFARHSEALMPVLDGLLGGLRCKAEDLDAIIVGTGPGSFTGLRVGVTTAKIMARLLKVPLLGTCSLDAIAADALSGLEGDVAVMKDAKKNNVYAALYATTGTGLKRLAGPEVVNAALWAKKRKRGTVFVGDGAVLYGKEIAAHRERAFRVLDDERFRSPSAVWLAAAAAPRLLRRRWDDPLRLEPLYLYPRDCNVLKK